MRRPKHLRWLTPVAIMSMLFMQVTGSNVVPSSLQMQNLITDTLLTLLASDHVFLIWLTEVDESVPQSSLTMTYIMQKSADTVAISTVQASPTTCHICACWNAHVYGSGNLSHCVPTTGNGPLWLADDQHCSSMPNKLAQHRSASACLLPLTVCHTTHLSWLSVCMQLQLTRLKLLCQTAARICLLPLSYMFMDCCRP